MRAHTVLLTIAAATMLVPAVATAQTTVEQAIQIMPSGGGPIQLPNMMGGARQFKTGTGRIRGRVLATDGGGSDDSSRPGAHLRC